MPARECRHIKTNGNQCRGVALRGKPLCYFHDRMQLREHRLHTQPALVLAGDASPAPIALELPLLEDADAVQVALSLVACAIAANQIEHRRAGVLLYALQIASMNLRSTELTYDLQKAVTSVALSDDGDDLAAD
jgi:hypothetical protein